jgi:Tol biopolymer transport system component/predicted Ser/Thr protein kinase
MVLAAGVRVGPYEVISPLGAGGMGEVYRARDARLGREVAIKVLPAEISVDRDRLKRFEKEARSASSLNHPNIVTIYDIGQADAVSYIAMELVEGKTLRELLLAGPLPIKKLLQIAAQVADGLAKAHEALIVHRDLKPENVMVTGDGRVKILDFGLAKVTQPDSDSAASDLLTVTRGTEPGIVMGTVGYMSPEQALGKPLDFRSDQFSFGSILYEMATGKRAFARGNAPETMAAIIREEPEPVAAVSPKTPPPLRWIVERCLAKGPDERYASTQDLAREIATVREHIAEISGTGETAASGVQPPRHRLRNGLVAGAVALAAALGYLAGPATHPARSPSFHRLTFRRGHISGARFSPEGQTIVYSAAWDGTKLETFLMRRESSDSRSLGFPGAHLWSVSSAAEMALGLGWKLPFGLLGIGTLARVSLSGGAARELLKDVKLADWSPDGKSLAVLRMKQEKDLLEFPIGRTLYEPADDLWDIRVSPKGDLVAFIEGEPAVIAVVDLAGKKRELSSGWYRAQGLAWSQKGDEVWFTASRSGHAHGLWAVSLSGRERLLTQVPGRLTLQDIAPDGSVLLTHENVRREMVGLAPGETRERDLTWLGYSWPMGLSRDGRTLFFVETSEERPLATLYVRKIDGSPPIRIGEGIAPILAALSPDGRWVFNSTPAPGGVRYELLPTGAGEPRPIAIRGLAEVETVQWFPDGEHLLVTGSAPGKKPRDYIIDLAGGQPRPITPEGVGESVISPDSKSVIAIDEQRGLSIYPVEGGEARRVVEKASGGPRQWSADGKSIYLGHYGAFNRVDKLDLASGRTELWKEFQPSDPTGVLIVQPMLVAPDGKSYVYTYLRVLSDLYLVEGLR